MTGPRKRLAIWLALRQLANTIRATGEDPAPWILRARVAIAYGYDAPESVIERARQDVTRKASGFEVWRWHERDELILNGYRPDRPSDDARQCLEAYRGTILWHCREQGLPPPSSQGWRTFQKKY